MTASFLALLLGASAQLKTGDKAPDFTLTDTKGDKITLSKELEKGPVILYFFPKAFTPGCTRQTNAYRDKYADAQKKGAQVFGISKDDTDTLKRFKADAKAQFELLSDGDGAVAKQYVGLMPVVGLANRANIVIGTDGVVKEIVTGSDAIDPSSAISACPGRKAGT
jgi:peroxiredoxin Q/BCP